MTTGLKLAMNFVVGKQDMIWSFKCSSILMMCYGQMRLHFWRCFHNDISSCYLKCICLRMYSIFILHCLEYAWFNSAFYFILLRHQLIKVYVCVCICACRKPMSYQLLFQADSFSLPSSILFLFFSLSQSPSLIILKTICLIPGYNGMSKTSSLIEVY